MSWTSKWLRKHLDRLEKEEAEEAEHLAADMERALLGPKRLEVAPLVVNKIREDFKVEASSIKTPGGYLVTARWESVSEALEVRGAALFVNGVLVIEQQIDTAYAIPCSELRLTLSFSCHTPSDWRLIEHMLGLR